MTQLPDLTMVIGGAASGKSVFAERVVIGTGKPPVYIATAQAFDDEMTSKIQDHRAARDSQNWRTIEEPLDLVGALSDIDADAAVLLDCATLWLTNLLLNEADIAQETDRLWPCLQKLNAPVVIVTNELGHGVISENRLSRRFVQLQGRFNQQLAAKADLVVQVTAGLPQVLKGQLP